MGLRCDGAEGTLLFETCCVEGPMSEIAGTRDARAEWRPKLAPFDKWFGTFHDGSPEAHARMTEQWIANRA